MGEVVTSGFFALISFLIGMITVFVFEKKFTLISDSLPQGTASQTMPVIRDKLMYYSGPGIAFTGLLLASIVLPFTRNIGSDSDIGIFYFIVVMDLVVLGVAMAGWGANTKMTVEACYRAVTQLIAYVIPLGLSLVGVAMMASSLSTQMIVKAQSGTWFVIHQPLGFVLYFAAGLMLSYRNPFAEPFSKNIAGGITTAYIGWQKTLIDLILSGILFLIAAFGTALFLGGWQGPPLLPDMVWFLGKTIIVIGVLYIISRRLPRLSVSQMLGISWKIFIPLGLVNVLATGLLILLGVTPK